MKPSKLVLKNGLLFPGASPARQQDTFYGEVVFNTGMTGYVESLTDPSYAGQIVCFTYPLIGNYGVPSSKFWESNEIQAAGVIVSRLSSGSYHYQHSLTFEKWLANHNIPLITNVDTRTLTKTLRSSGVMLGAITSPTKSNFNFYDPNTTNLVAKVSCKKKTVIGKGKKTVIVIDCGMKKAQIRLLKQFPLKLIRVPYNYDYTNDQYDGIFISNGPGNPTMCKETIDILKKALKKEKPIFGICLGIQLMGLAAGAKTYKLPYGHRGQNQPCQDLKSKRCFITSQNHGYAIDTKTIPTNWEITYRNLNDHSVAGIAHKKLPFFSVQFHPEANAGPTDTQFLFETFYKML